MSTNNRFKITNRYYGQIILGPPGAGKTTYCNEMSKLLKKSGRNTVIVNLDPANDGMSYKPDIDIRALICLEDVMDKYKLGPNGALIYCMEFLEKNVDWLLDQLKGEHSTNFIFDLPGQVELYCHHNTLSNILSLLTKNGNFQLCAVHLVDSHHCSDAGKFIAALTLSLNAMLKIGLPHVNLLTKVDLLKKHANDLLFGIDFYTEVLDLNYLVDCLDSDKFTAKYKKLNKALVSVIENYSLVTFQLVDMFKEDSLTSVKKLVDKANGYIFKAEEGRHINSMLSCAMGFSDSNTEEFDMSEKLHETYSQLLLSEIKIDQLLHQNNKSIEVQLLHQYNDIKDATQIVINHIANMEGTTVAEIHKRLKLN